MYLASLVFLGFAGLMVCVVLGMILHQQIAILRKQTASSPKAPHPDDKNAWDVIAKTWTNWYSQRREMDISRQKAILSWGRTFVLCTGLCLTGVCLEVEFNCSISIDHILAGLIPSYSSVHIKEMRAFPEKGTTADYFNSLHRNLSTP